MIDIWKEVVVASPASYIGWGGLLIGVVFGFIVFRTNFCTMGAISDIFTFGDYRRFRSWVLAGATAMFGVVILQTLDIANVDNSMYMSSNFGWLANVVGGLLFGFGMVFSGGCLSRNLVRAGGGDMRSVVILIIAGIAGFMTIGGLLGPLRVRVFGPATVDLSALGLETQGSGEILSVLTGIDASIGKIAVPLIVVALLLVYCLKDAGFRASPKHLVAGIGIGLTIVAGWMLTGLAQDDFADVRVPLISLSFVRPTGDTLDYLMRFTALGAPGFGVVTLAGTVLGGFFGAMSTGRLHLTTFADNNDTVRNMFGASLMGIGGVLALGCTIGQGLTGISTLAIGSLITFVFIVAGGVIGVKSLERIVLNA